MSDSSEFARIHLEEYVSSDPLGLQRVVSNVMFESTSLPTDYAIVENIVLALIPKNNSLKLAVEQGINQVNRARYSNLSARISAVAVTLKANVASDLLAILNSAPSSTGRQSYSSRFALATAYHFVESVVAADPIIRRSAQNLLDSLPDQESPSSHYDDVEASCHCAHA